MSYIHRRLTKALNGTRTMSKTLNLDSPHKLAVLSDLHRGVGDPADAFKKCAGAYETALGYYKANGYGIMLLGDVEELWGGYKFAHVEKEYRGLLDLEAEFQANGYHRVWGNHDNKWRKRTQVKNKLARRLPVGAVVVEALRYELYSGGQHVGRLFLVHGHQGTFFSDRIADVSELFLAVKWGVINTTDWIRRKLGFKKKQRSRKQGRSPSTDIHLRANHDWEMYRWAAGYSKMLIITGHTHRPVWASRTHVQELEQELKDLQADPQSTAEDIKEKKREIAYRKQKDLENMRVGSRPITGGLGSVPTPKPCYFNTGCCKFNDGDITCMELEDGTLRLIRWSEKTSTKASNRFVLQPLVQKSGSVVGLLAQL